MSICGQCGMPVEDGPHYHPYAACLMFKQTHSSAQVEANLAAVIEHAAAAERARIRREWQNARDEWYRDTIQNVSGIDAEHIAGLAHWVQQALNRICPREPA